LIQGCYCQLRHGGRILVNGDFGHGFSFGVKD
jgi:hypothetical protein